MRRLPPFHALRAFEAAARHQSMVQASEELLVTHSAISQQIKNLEDYYGHPLFIRKGRGLETTPEAQILLHEVGAAFDRIAQASEQFASRNEGREIFINATPSFALRWLIPKSSKFQLENPSISLVLETSSSLKLDELTRGYDFIFRKIPMEKSGFQCERLLDDISTPVMSPKLMSNHKYASPRDLVDAVLLHLKSRPDAWNDWLKKSDVPNSHVIPGVYYEHFFLSLQAAINGFGVAFGAMCQIEDDLSDGRLVAPFPNLTLEGPGFHVLYSPATLRSRKHRAFLEMLKQEAERSNELAGALI